MDRLLIFLTLLSATAIAGALIAICASLGYVSVWAFLACILAALFIAWPGAVLATRGLRAWQRQRDVQPRSTSTDPTE